MNFCQSCAMPLGDNEELLGTNADGSKSELYCKYCYENGNFTWNCIMDEMIDFCVPHMKEANPDMSETEAREIMRKVFPTLERWKKD